ncbi:MAG: asparagine synthase-related protein [candidate division KSB1 bacterium]|nr:asparagine synthase-related protein [candidate division KSB1 bacterium]
MPGIYGVVTEDIEEVVKPLEPAIRRLLTHGEGYRAAHYAEAGVLLGHVALEKGDEHLAIAQEDEKTIVLDGVIYDGESVGLSGPAAGAAAAQQVSRLVGEMGMSMVARLNGSFVGCLWNRRERELVLFNDRYGLRPLYYCHVPGKGLAFAPDVKALRPIPWVPFRPSEEGVVEFLEFRQLLDDRTLFDGIRLFPPGCIARWKNGRLHLERYWDYRPQPAQMSLQEAVHRFHCLMQQAVRRQLKTSRPVGLLLSGGLDSRSVLAPAVPVAPHLRTYTYGTPRAADVRLAKRLASACGVFHRLILQEPTFLEKVGEEGVWITEGMLPCERFQAFDAYPTILADGTEVLLSGVSGDLLTGCYLKPRFLEARAKTSLEDAIPFLRPQPFAKPERKELLTPRLYARYAEHAEETLRQALERYRDGWTPQQAFDHFRWYQFHRRIVVFAAKLASVHFDVRSPFYDYDLVDFLATVPFELKLGQRFYREWFATFYPDLARIPSPRYGLPIRQPIWPVRAIHKLNPMRNPYFWDGLARGRYWLRKIGLGSLVTLRPVPSGGADYPEWYRGPLRNYVLRLLTAPDARYPEFVQRDTVHRMLREHWEVRHDYHSSKLGLVLTLELWLRRFFQ